MQVATISSKRQVTLPKRLLDQYGVKPKNKIILQPLTEGLLIKPIEGASVVDQVAGSLTRHVSPKKLGQPFPSIMKEAKRRVSRKLAQE